MTDDAAWLFREIALPVLLDEGTETSAALPMRELVRMCRREWRGGGGLLRLDWFDGIPTRQLRAWFGPCGDEADPHVTLRWDLDAGQQTALQIWLAKPLAALEMLGLAVRRSRRTPGAQLK